MPMVTPLTPDTAEAMRAQVIHLSPTVEISMRMTEGGAKAEDNTTLIVLSSILKPREEMGRAFNQAPDSLVEAAMRRARDCASGALILQHRIGHRRYFGGIPDLLAMGSRSHRWRIVLRDHDARAESTWSKSCGPK